MHSFVRQSLACLLLVSLIASSKPAKAQQPFLLKSATLVDSIGYYKLESSIPANDTAAVVFTIPGNTDTEKDKAEEIAASLRSPQPFQNAIEVFDSAPKRTVLTVTIVAAAAIPNARLTFIADSDWSIQYDVDQTGPTLSGHVQIKDVTGSDAKWSDATILVRGFSGDVPLSNLANMKPGQSIVLPADTNPGIALTPLQTHLRLQDDKFFEVISMTNNGPGRLLTGMVVLTNGGHLVSSNTLANHVMVGQTTDLPIRETTSLTLLKADVDAYYETTQLVKSTITVINWEGKSLTIRNAAFVPHVVHIGKRSVVPVAAEGSAIEFVGSQRKPTNNPEAKDLLDIDETKLDDNLKMVKTLRIFDSVATQSKIQSVIPIYDIIAASRIRLDGLRTAKTTVEGLITLAQATGMPNEVQRLQDELMQITTDVGREEMVEPRQRINLVQLLL